MALSRFFRVPELVALIYTDRGNGNAEPVSADNPMPVVLTGPAPVDGSTDESEVVSVVYPSLTLTSGVGQQGLLPHPAANRARIRRVSGQVRAGLGNAVAAPLLGSGEPLEVRDAQVAQLRVDVSDGDDGPGVVFVESWRAGPVPAGQAPVNLPIGEFMYIVCANRNSQGLCQLRAEPDERCVVTMTAEYGGPFAAWVISRGVAGEMITVAPGTPVTVQVLGVAPDEELFLRVAPDPRQGGSAEPGRVLVEMAPAAVQVE